MLAGEYSVLECGGHALAVAVEPGFAVTAVAARGVRLSLPDLGIDYSLAGLPEQPLSAPHRALLHPLWSLVLLREQYGVSLPGLALEFRRAPGSSLPVGASSALAVASVRGAAAVAELDLSSEELFRIAATAHARAQGGGSGYDVAACAYGGVVFYRRPEQPLPWEEEGLSMGAEVKPGWPAVSSRPALDRVCLAAADSGRPSDTPALLRRFANAGADPGFRQALAEHREASNRLCAGLWEGSRGEALSGLVAEANASLERLDRAGNLGVLTTELEQLLHIAGEARIPARVSGAGGGDVAVGLAPDEEAAAQLAAAWRTAGFAAKSFTHSLIAIQ